MADELDTDVLRLTVKIVSALISYNQVEAVGLPELIQSVYRSWAADAGRPDPQLGAAGLHCLLGGRQEAEDAQASPPHQPWHDAGAIPAEVGTPARLPHGGPELRQPSRAPRQAGPFRSKAGEPQAGRAAGDERGAEPRGSASGDARSGAPGPGIQRLSRGLPTRSQPAIDWPTRAKGS